MATASALLLAGATSVFLLILIARVAVNVPFSNEFDLVPLYRYIAERTLPPLTEILAGLIGHPLILLKALVFATLISGAPWTWMMYAQVPLLASSLLLIYQRIPDAATPLLRYATAGGLAMIVVTPRHWENLYMAMQIVTAIWLASSIAAFYFVQKYCCDGRTRWLTIALAFALIATVNTGAGIVSLIITLAGLVFARKVRSSRENLLITLAAILGIGTWAISLSLAPVGGVGGGRLPVDVAFAHALRMFAHSVIDLPLTNGGGIALGALTLALVAYCLWQGLRKWREVLFEVSCIGLGVALILGVTYGRVKMGLFQPEASRYVVLVIPITVGCALLFLRLHSRLLLAVLLITVLLGSLRSAYTEWGAAPYRRAALEDGYTALCKKGEAPAALPALLLHAPLTPEATRDVQSVFCR
jgi:hypothetical protein